MARLRGPQLGVVMRMGLIGCPVVPQQAKYGVRYASDRTMEALRWRGLIEDSDLWGPGVGVVPALKLSYEGWQAYYDGIRALKGGDELGDDRPDLRVLRRARPGAGGGDPAHLPDVRRDRHAGPGEAAGAARGSGDSAGGARRAAAAPAAAPVGGPAPVAAR